ncbi:hypothetical protein [Streptomyces sp. NRRL F-5123]|uniref:hypothetical protein n=1 Tax=Streptomyces sp. NRRL F-5123 TaxID=1463856 RepID=UPI0004E17E91|nr:hypothetical protein [Streptomyces sp. NRRL F-5123]
MSDQSPRVRVHLPGDAPARLQRWRQGPDGRWWAEVTLYAPATALQQIPGEDYSSVPRETATGPDVQYVIVAPKLPPDQPVRAELHRAGCWTIPRAETSTLRVTPVESAEQARGLLGFQDTTACTACQPEP